MNTPPTHEPAPHQARHAEDIVYDSNTRTRGAPNRVIDLRSDTVTRPTPAMREAMAEADVGDDVFGDDPTVNALEERVAALVGKEAGLFVPSGTQSNFLALITHCARGEEIITGRDYHVNKYEAGGASAFGGAILTALPQAANGSLTPDQIAAAVKPDDSHLPVSRLVSLENTWNGRVQDQANIEAIAVVARANGLSLHLDGARLMNAVIATRRSAADLAAPFDTVSLCLSKGLGAPIGSVLSGPRDFIRKARRNRKMAGGGMRQAGVLAACGLHALDHHVERLAQDHANAKRLAQALSAIPGLVVDYPANATNMVWVTLPDGAFAPLQKAMAEQGILLLGGGNAMRIVAHLDVTEDDMTCVADAMAAYFGAG